MSICELCRQRISGCDLAFDWLGEIIVPAIDSFYCVPEDRDLRVRDVSERAIVANIFVKMSQILSEKQVSNIMLQNLNIDFEYNRNFCESKTAYAQKCNSCNKKDECEAKIYSSENKNMIPDIIIHTRNTNRNNQVVIEFKKNESSDTKNDIAKLTYFTCQRKFDKPEDEDKNYKYSIGFFIVLNNDCSYDVHCFKDGNPIYSRKRILGWKDINSITCSE